MPRAVIVSQSDEDAGVRGTVPVSSFAPDGAGVLRSPLIHREPAAAATAGSSVGAGSLRMLTKPAEFERCLARSPIVRSGAFALHVASSVAPAGAADWRLGLVIPKRYEASAVARNTIKRRWRAAFATTRGACAVEFGAADLVVRMQSALVGKRSPPDVLAALAPAKRRARTTFDPHAILGILADRMRKSAERDLAARPVRT